MPKTLSGVLIVNPVPRCSEWLKISFALRFLEDEIKERSVDVKIWQRWMNFFGEDEKRLWTASDIWRGIEGSE